MKVELTNYTGSDLTVVNSARVSLGKTKKVLDNEDIKLIKYLIDNKHVSTLEHCFFTFRLEIPIYIARQLMRHRSWSFNEISGRYVEFEDSFFTPESFRLQDKSIKQGSKEDTENKLNQEYIKQIYQKSLDVSYMYYKELLSLGVCKEQARGVLPSSLNTQLTASCNLRSFLHFLEQRLHSHAQKEIREMSYLMLQEVQGIEGEPFKNVLKNFWFNNEV